MYFWHICIQKHSDIPYPIIFICHIVDINMLLIQLIKSTDTTALKSQIPLLLYQYRYSTTVFHLNYTFKICFRWKLEFNELYVKLFKINLRKLINKRKLKAFDVYLNSDSSTKNDCEYKQYKVYLIYT